MGTMRLVLDACGRGPTTEVGVDRLGELLAIARTGCGSTSPTPAMPRCRSSGHLRLPRAGAGRYGPPARASPVRRLRGLLLRRGLRRRASRRRDRAAGAQFLLGRELSRDDPPRARHRRRRAGRGAPALGAARAIPVGRDRLPGVHPVRQPGGRLLRGAGPGARADRGDRGRDLHRRGRRRGRPVPAPEGAAPGAAAAGADQPRAGRGAPPRPDGARRASSPTSPTCRTTPSTCWRSWTPIATCSAPRSTSTCSPRSTGWGSSCSG